MNSLIDCRKRIEKYETYISLLKEELSLREKNIKKKSWFIKNRTLKQCIEKQKVHELKEKIEAEAQYLGEYKKRANAGK
jgi:hypothetical protein